MARSTMIQADVTAPPHESPATRRRVIWCGTLYCVTSVKRTERTDITDTMADRGDRA